MRALRSTSADKTMDASKQVTVAVLVQWALDGSEGDIEQAHEDLFDACYFAIWDAHTRNVPGARATCTKIAEIFGVIEPISGKLTSCPVFRLSKVSEVI